MVFRNLSPFEGLILLIGAVTAPDFGEDCDDNIAHNDGCSAKFNEVANTQTEQGIGWSLAEYSRCGNAAEKVLIVDKNVNTGNTARLRRREYIERRWCSERSLNEGTRSIFRFAAIAGWKKEKSATRALRDSSMIGAME